MTILCRHCRRLSVSKPRGLCYSCYQNRAVRPLYGSSHRGARRGIADFHRATQPPPEPTDAPPGSREKVAVLAARAAAGLSLFHPKDAGLDGRQRCGIAAPDQMTEADG